MADDNKKNKPGFFSRLFGISNKKNESIDVKIKEPKKETSLTTDIPSKSSVSKMKKADIVELAKSYGLELDIKLTKALLLEAWVKHFEEIDTAASKQSSEEESLAEENSVAEEAPAAEEETPVAEVTESAAEETPVAEVTESAAEETQVAEEFADTSDVDSQTDTELQDDSPSDTQYSGSTIVERFEKKQLNDSIPNFRPGDTLVVSVKVKDGQRTRLQNFEGVVMSFKKRGLNSSFIVRKISSGIGVERTFQLHSPLIDSITVKRKGDVRKAKLFYLRDRSGKSARIKERLD